MSNIVIRPMELKDLDQVEEIERKSFTSVWTKNLYKKELLENHFAYYFVIEKDDKLIGFCGLWLVLDEAQVTNIAVDPQYRGQGYGAMLFQYMLNHAMTRGATNLSLEVRYSNYTAQRLYQKFGLEKAGIRKNYYTDNNEDAIVMWVRL
ncbi:MAG: ribosomal protein S18-alanine N-acetyltransferase [Amphibacillus sp.]|uniref:[Ribosomal protein bS18]-alanine N-acetyltransferase n=1 Tax=Amphibacillus xylanus (strain ATCC 51415 / DSM 6626 / JCM 7361 / LMG 17667 / NBRC 15112 / Ep01) TaxID=698758 RepID=K0IVN6_AMPXN|nr:ribosomal protein S18-alanine N-acetyltransferase [Amphibacillus xylanus]NMA89753.1 ribosomal protein S18-alanine N-acetyltransferase [Amphibacillus sp.]BAM46494.1 ribosomal-protein-alanine acetyltransferase [Amphibacillus xylanus NBRC 15112]